MNKDIFKYSNGAEDFFGDPVYLMRQFVIACGGDYQERMKQAFPDPYPKDPSANAVVAQATNVLFVAVRKAFDLVPWNPKNGEGASDDHVYSLLHAFMDFWQKKNATTENSPTSPTPTASDAQ